MFRSLSLIALAALFCVCLGATPGQQLFDPNHPLQSGKGEQLTFWQKLDHFDPNNKATFPQQYFQDNSVWDSAKGTTILYIGGEGPVTGTPHINESYIGQLARRFSARIVVLEHRFYGQSIPMLSTPDTALSTANLKFLTSAQALEDLAAFRHHIAHQLVNETAQIITIGGSYAGALAAFFRLKYPHLTDGSLSSSGVVEAREWFPEFDQQVATSVGPDCADALRNMTFHIEQVIGTSKAAADNLKRMFMPINTPYTMKDQEFLYFTADAMSLAPQYGRKDELCQPLLAIPFYSQELRLAAFANYTQQIFYNKMHNTWEGYADQFLVNTSIANRRGDRQWWWQTCTEFGFFQIAPAVNSIRSAQVNTTFFQDRCTYLFGVDSKGNKLEPTVDMTNRVYGGKNIQATNVHYTEGVEDPWRDVCMSESKPDQPFTLINCPNAAHCVDLYSRAATDCGDLTSARDSVGNNLDAWLAADGGIVPTPSPSPAAESSKAWKIATLVLAPLLGLALIALIVLLCLRNKHEAYIPVESIRAPLVSQRAV